MADAPAVAKPAIPMPNLPQGVEAFDMRPSEDEDFYLMDGVIHHGKRPNSAADLIVRPAKGYKFMADIDNLGSYFCVRIIDPPIEVVTTARFTITNSLDQEAVDKTVDILKKLPMTKSVDVA